MGDIPGFLASEFPEDARFVPGQEAFTARGQADDEGESADDAENERDEKQIFYKQDAEGQGEGAADGNPDIDADGDADL